MVTGVDGAGGIGGTCDAFQRSDISAVDEDGRSALYDERRQHLERRLPVDDPQPCQNRCAGVVTGRGDPSPLRRISLR